MAKERSPTVIDDVTPAVQTDTGVEYRYAGEEVSVHAKLTARQFRRVERLLGYPENWLGRHKSYATSYFFEPLTPFSGRTVCAYLRQIGVVHEHRVTRSWTRKPRLQTVALEDLGAAEQDLDAAELRVVKRTFEARKHPPGDPERHRLNSRRATSEYQGSLRYEANVGHRSAAFRNRQLAIDWAVIALCAIDRICATTRETT